MKNKAALVASITVLSLVLGIGIAKITGYWKTENSKVPVTISEGNYAGESDPGDIRGSYSFADIEKAFGVPPEMLAAAFGVQGTDPAVIQVKSLEDVWGTVGGDMEIGTDSVRLFTSLWTGIPYEPEGTTALPETAVLILEAYGKIDAETAARFSQTAAALPGEVGGETPPAEQNYGSTVSPEDHDIPDRTVRGLTTFGELERWGVTEQMWMEKVGEAMGTPSTSLKDWAASTGRSMSEIKPAAQELVDSGA